MNQNILFNIMKNTIRQNNPQMNEMLNAFNSFRQNLTPEMAEQKVVEMLNNGQMSKEQFENLKNMAQYFMNNFLK